MSPARPSLSIIVPLYNKAAYIGEAIASLATQHQPPEALIIVDDASTDGSLEACQQALEQHAAALTQCRCRVLASRFNGGPGAARNLGLQEATTDLIAFLDADDGYQPSALAQIRAAFRQHDLQMLVLGYQSDPPGERFPDVTQLDGVLSPLESGLLALQTPLQTVTGPQFFMGRASNVVVRRRWLTQLRFDGNARLNEGIDFWYRVLKHILAADPKARIGLCITPLIRFRLLPDSLSHRPCARWQDLPAPPSVLRFLHSNDRFDRRLVLTLAERWLAHAVESLPDEMEQQTFWQQHAALFESLGIVKPRALR